MRTATATKINKYQERGFASRAEYLDNLATEYDITFDEVLNTAEKYGTRGDFTRLIQDLNKKTWEKVNGREYDTYETISGNIDSDFIEFGAELAFA